MTHPLELFDVRKTYGDFVAVSGVSMTVPAGSIFGLLGPNGAGKTTTIRMMLDILAPDAGEVHFFGHPRCDEDLRRVGYLPEERGLYRKMTVVEQLLFLAEIRGLSRRTALPKVLDWLERVELGAWGKKKVEELSKGMQQKVQLIGTVLHEPELLILDEPFSGLDPLNQELFRQLLFDYRKMGRSILLSTHGMEFAERLCDQICLISRGRVVLSGDLREIKRSRGGNAYRLLGADGPFGLSDLDTLGSIVGVASVVAIEGGAKLLLEAGVDGPDLLPRILERFRVREFRSEEPDLEQIFLEAVRHAA